MAIPTGGTAPLMISDDEALIAEVLRLSAAGGVVPAVVREAEEALRLWSIAPLVLVGADQAESLAELQPPRRERVHVLGAGELPDALFRAAVLVGAESVSALPASETWLVELLTDVADGAVAGGRLVGVIGGSGGAGATVFATALALHAAERAPALLVDIDPLGAGVDHVLGADRTEGVRWDALMQATGRLSARSLRESLPRCGRLSLLAWPAERLESLPAFAVREVLSAGRRGFGTVVLDLPRQRDPVAEEVVAQCDRVVLVCALTVPGVVAASRLVPRLPAAPRTGLVARGGPAGVAAEEAARVLGLPLLGAMPDQRGLDEAIGLGAGPLRSRRGVLARTAGSVGRALAEGGEGGGAA